MIHEWDNIDQMNDLDAIVSLSSACDQVISAATASYMISGSVGVPTWRLALLADKILLGAMDTYPFFIEMRPFRKTLGMSWDNVIKIVASGFRDMASHKQ
ncbi:MAG: hypothetical protein RIQ73_150 [Actinomycetota bacterium]